MWESFAAFYLCDVVNCKIKDLTHASCKNLARKILSSLNDITIDFFDRLDSTYSS